MKYLNFEIKKNMFGNNNMMQKLQQMQEQAEKSKEKLNQIIVESEAGGNLINIEMNGNRVLKSISINTELKEMDKEDLEDLLVVALNRALTKANEVNEKEMANSAKGLFPGM